MPSIYEASRAAGTRDTSAKQPDSIPGLGDHGLVQKIETQQAEIIQSEVCSAGQGRLPYAGGGMHGRAVHPIL